jgi:hypothetical protein
MAAIQADDNGQVSSALKKNVRAMRGEAPQGLPESGGSEGLRRNPGPAPARVDSQVLHVATGVGISTQRGANIENFNPE